MISSLLMLSLTAFVGCACVYGIEQTNQLQPKFAVGDTYYTSHVDNLSYQEYYSKTINLDELTNWYSLVYTFDFANSTSNTTPSNTNYDFATFDLAYKVGVADSLYTSIGYKDLYMIYNHPSGAIHQYYINFFLPFDSNVKNIEISFNNDFYLSYYYNTAPSGTSGQYYMLHDYNYSSFGYDSAVSRPYRFLCFSLRCPMDDWTQSNTFEIHCLGDAQGSDYQRGYNNGYQSGKTDGYNQGKSEGYDDGYHDGEIVGDTAGYQRGFAEGVASASNGTFNNLFNAIADTPIVFIRSLFNFDLFGMNMFIVIMSLLTGIIVIYVIKKVVK